MGVLDFLAMSPQEFAGAGGIVSCMEKSFDSLFPIANAGLHAELPVFCDRSCWSSFFFAILPFRQEGDRSFLAIELKFQYFGTDGKDNHEVYRTHLPTPGST